MPLTWGRVSPVTNEDQQMQDENGSTSLIEDHLSSGKGKKYTSYDEQPRVQTNSTFRFASKRVSPEEHLNNWIKNTGAKEISRRDWILKEIEEKCVLERENVTNYKNLFGFLLFTLLYLGILVSQRQSGTSFQISNVIYEYLPENALGSDGFNGQFTSWSQVVDYLNDNIIREIWQNTQCGDGHCVHPFEDVGWGRADNIHGCKADCGQAPELTKIIVYLDYTFPSHGLLKEKLRQGKEEYAEPQQLEWNLCTDNFDNLERKCWFKTPQIMHPGESVEETMHLPDNIWVLRISGDTRYVRGKMSAEVPLGRNCQLRCTNEDMARMGCAFHCTNATAAEKDGRRGLPQLSHVELHHFEVCAYNPGPDGTKTWRDYPFDAPCEDGSLRLSTDTDTGTIQISINQTWVELCTWEVGHYVIADEEISNVCRRLGYDWGYGYSWTTNDDTKFFPGNCYRHELPGACTASEEQYRNKLVAGSQCPWSYTVRCLGHKSSDTCKNSNAASSALGIDTTEPITHDWFNLTLLGIFEAELLSDSERMEGMEGAEGMETPQAATPSGSMCAAVNNPPPVEESIDTASQAFCTDSDPLPCFDHLHFDTTRCLILYHQAGRSCGMTIGDLVNQTGICEGSGSLESLLSDASLEATATIADVCPETCCSSLDECMALGRLRLAGESSPRHPNSLKPVRYEWEGRLEIWTTDFSTNYSGWSAVLTTRGWEPVSALKACQQLGYDSMLTSDVRKVTEVEYPERIHQPTLTAYWPAEPGKANTRLAIKKCKGNETSLLQCPLEDWWSFDTVNNKMKVEILDMTYALIEAPGANTTWWDIFESGLSVATLQCHNKSAESPPLFEDLCKDGKCCSPQCLQEQNTVYQWEGAMECYFEGFSCYELQTCRNTGQCASDIGIKHNQVCNPECNNAACRMDDWDCCEPGYVFHPNSGFEHECCKPTPLSFDHMRINLKTFSDTNNTGAHPDHEQWTRALNNNHVVAGMIVHQTRRELTQHDTLVSGSAYPAWSGKSLASFGRNPYFLASSSLYDRRLNAAVYYENDETIQACMTGEGACYAFDHYKMPGLPDGFPMVISSDLSGDEAQELVQYMIEGSFLDQRSKDLRVQLVLYNPNSEQVVNVLMDFNLCSGGGIRFRYKVQPMDVEVYDSTVDYVRLVFEIIFVVCTVFICLIEISDAYRVGSLRLHFSSLWNTLDMISICINFASIGLWIYMIYYASHKLDLRAVYEIYPHQKRQWGRIQYAEDELRELASQFEKVTHIGSMYSKYMTLCGTNIILFMFRIFKLMHFQPRVGMITRTILKGLDDLIHVAFLLVLVFSLYGMVGYIIFGPTIKRFSTIPVAMRTVCAMMLGEFFDVMTDLFDTNVDAGELQYPAYLFFYSFMGLVFLVMLNFLLAIVVDSFAEIKKVKEGSEDASMYKEVYHLVRNSLNDWMRNKMELQEIETDLSKMQNRPLPRRVSFMPADIVPTELGVVMVDDSYLVKMNKELLAKALQRNEDPEQGRPMQMDDGVDKGQFAKKVVEHYGNRIPKADLQLPITQTSETEEIKEVIGELIGESNAKSQENQERLTKQLEEILMILKKGQQNGNHVEGG